jgi:hypothetical protein
MGQRGRVAMPGLPAFFLMDLNFGNATLKRRLPLPDACCRGQSPPQSKESSHTRVTDLPILDE